MALQTSFPVLPSNAQATPEAVREILQAFRANYPRRTFWPLRVESVPELPLLLNGKIDLVSLPALPNKTVHWFQRI